MQASAPRIDFVDPPAQHGNTKTFERQISARDSAHPPVPAIDPLNARRGKAAAPPFVLRVPRRVLAIAGLRDRARDRTQRRGHVWPRLRQSLGL